MFWKIAERMTKAGRRVAAVRSWSIVRRLTVFYAVVAIALLLTATGLLYWVLNTSLREAQTAFLMDEITKLTGLVNRVRNEPEAAGFHAALEGEARRRGRYYARILDTSGAILVQSEAMRVTLPPPVGFPRIKPGDEPVVLTARWQAPDGRFFLLGAGRAQSIDDDRRQPLIQVALDISADEVTLRQYRRWLLTILSLGVVASAVAGTFIARQSLRPLEEITHAAQRITVTQLHARIQAGRWPTELRALASEFDKMLARLEESFIRLSQFSADIAHELRTPVNNLLGEAEVALSRSRTTPEYREVLESSLEEFGRLRRMIDSLLFLARAENAETRLERTEFDVVKEIRSVVEFYEPLSEETGVKLTCPQATGSRPSRVMLWADSILFRRALSNLIGNALHHTPRGGEVEIVARETSDQWVEVSVRDTGCGIAAEHHEKIFDRFYRVDPARTSHPGTGLGLPIVKSIAHLHCGSVRLESDIGKGSTFTLRFPANGTVDGQPPPSS
jgi:two-component system heavy metal sensor histidine kinase CusS